MKSSNDIVGLPPDLREAARCEACGTEFTCGATLAECWCAEIKLSDEARADLGARYQSCLCRQCLESLENRKA